MSADTPTKERAGMADAVAAAPAEARPWVTWLHNDPYNITHYVVAVLVQVCAMSEQAATEAMLRAHTQGAAVVFGGTKAEATDIAVQLRSLGLYASAEEDPS